MENNIYNKIERVETNVLDEVFLNQIMKDFDKGNILGEIDQSLKDKNKETFLCLTEDLRTVSQ
jgi:uncharacterized protein YpiB (UPF0302 family)